jgi:hypothetical protein
MRREDYSVNVLVCAATEAAKAVAMTRQRFREKPMAGNPAAPLTAFKRAETQFFKH